MTKKRIMIVEDETVVAEDIRNCLVKSGYCVTASVCSGEKAVDLIAKEAPDLILMDIRLAGRMDGIETSRRIAQMSDVPIIFLTAYSDADTLERAKKADPYGYLVKPFDRNELKCAIEMTLLKHERMREKAKKIRDLEERNYALQNRIQSLAGPSAAVMDLGFGFFYDDRNRNLLFWDREVKLTKKERLFIHLLAENRGRTIPFSRIESYVWGTEKGVDQNAFGIFLWRLRSKIGWDLVKNTMGVGYRIDKPS